MSAGQWRCDNQVTPGDTQWFDTETDAHEYAAAFKNAVVWFDSANYEGGAA